MAKEFKVISNKFAEKIIDDLNQHGQEGWNISAYVQEFGVTKFILERDAGDNILANSLDTLTGLVSLLSDEKKTQKLISDLKTAYSSHTDGLDKLLSFKDDLQKQTSDFESAKTVFETEKKSFDTDKLSFTNLQKNLQDQKESLESQKKAFEEESKQTQSSLDKLIQTFENDKILHNSKVQTQLQVLTQSQIDIDNKTAALQVRENLLAQQEKEHDDIRLQTQELAQRLRRN